MEWLEVFATIFPTSLDCGTRLEYLKEALPTVLQCHGGSSA